MSILKFERRTPKSLAAMYDYVTDVNKTDFEHIFGIGVNPLYAVQEMEFVQQIYHKTNLLHPYLQVIFSFDQNTAYNMSQITEICKEIGLYLLIDRRQLLGAIHYKNERNIHCHYIINTVGIDGSVYKQVYSLHFYKERVNLILAKYNLNSIYYYQKNIS